ncbi:MAG: hypothetical protein HFI47_14815 [Lachnospiraceae bacterium]|jgi:hypothetical protein|nr:hypothetical protein [Lachnospiraceae bacterium]
MSLEEIEVNFEQMKALGDSLSLTAKGLCGIANDSGIRTLTDLRAAWVSGNADAFARKEVRILEQIRESAGKLDALSCEIRKKAEQIYRLEVWNTLTARARSYR